MGHSYIVLLDAVFGNYFNINSELDFYWDISNILFIKIFSFLNNIIPSYTIQYLYIWLVFITWFLSITYLFRTLNIKNRFIYIFWLFYYIFSPFIYTRFLLWQIGIVWWYMAFPLILWIGIEIFNSKIISNKNIIIASSITLLIGMLNIRFFPMAILFINIVLLSKIKEIWKKQYLLNTFNYNSISIISSLYWIIPFMLARNNSINYSNTEFSFFGLHWNSFEILNKILISNWTWSDNIFKQFPDFYKFWINNYIILIPLIILSWYWFYINKNKFKYIILWFAAFAGIFSTGLSIRIFAPINQFIIGYIPFFSWYREPGKWLIWVVIFYLFYSIYALIELENKWKIWKLFVRIYSIILPIFLIIMFYIWVYRMWIFVEYPWEWYEAKQFADNNWVSNEKVVVFPWHWYIGCDFTNRRIITNPSKTFFWPNYTHWDNIQIKWVYSDLNNPFSLEIENLVWPNAYDTKFEWLTKTMRKFGYKYIMLWKNCSDITYYKPIYKQNDINKIYSNEKVDIFKIK